MAKQTFTTGQVLTAAQMTSLQQTAMLGGAASAKTASYTLVAADAGTAISMSNAGATTITVNTALFAAGDTVQITNLGAGVCTITAGTATVNTASSLALAQYESGTLYFTSTSAAIFIKGDGAAAGGGIASATASVDAAQTTTSSSAGDLATAGPAVTLTTGTSALVIVNAKLGNDTNSCGAIMFFQVSGATTIAVAEERSLLFENGGANSFYPRASAAYRVTLTAGSNTFTAKYARIAGGTAYFATRVITVIDLGS